MIYYFNYNIVNKTISKNNNSYKHAHINNKTKIIKNNRMKYQ